MLCTLLRILSVSGISTECQTEWNNVLASQSNPDLPDYYSKMYLYSGFGINSLGNFESCKELMEAKYVLEVYSEVPLVVVCLCGPKVCNESDYYDSPMPAFELNYPPNYLVIFPAEYQDENYGTYSFGAILMIVFIAAIIGLSAHASFAHYYFWESREYFWSLRFLLCFSAIKNGKELVRPTGLFGIDSLHKLAFLNGIVAITVWWVILGDVFMNCIFLAATSNFNTTLESLTEFGYSIVYGYIYTSDVLFWVIGVIFTYQCIIDHSEKSFPYSCGIFQIYIHNYLWITSVFIFCTLFSWSLQEYIGSGPVWLNIKDLIGNCSDYWWTNLIYLSNIIPGVENICIDDGWLLAIAGQFIFLTPMVALIYKKFSKLLSWLIIAAMCCLSTIVAGLVAQHFDLNPVIMVFVTEPNYTDYYKNMTYTRMSPLALGIACGIIAYNYRKYKDSSNTKDRLSLFIVKLLEVRYIRVCSFILGLILMNGVLYFQYLTYKNPGSGKYESWTNTQNYTFIALEKLVFGLGLSFIFLPMLLGYFKPIAEILGSYPFSVLSKFSITLYVMQGIISQILFKSQKNVLIFDFYNNMRDTVYVFIFSLIASIFIHMFIVMPIMNMEKLILNIKNKFE